LGTGLPANGEAVIFYAAIAEAAILQTDAAQLANKEESSWTLGGALKAAAKKLGSATPNFPLPPTPNFKLSDAIDPIPVASIVINADGSVRFS